MKIAIIGSKSFDSLEYHLNESFNYNGYKCQIFDIYDNWLFKAKLFSKYTFQLDFLGRRYSDSYDQKVFNQLYKKVELYKPDLVIGIYRFIHPSFVAKIKQLGCKIIHINPDALTTFEFQQIFASDYDMWLTKDPYIVSFMKSNMHLNVEYYNEAFNVRIHPKPEIIKEQHEREVGIDVMTYGTLYPYRTRMLKSLLDSGINLKLYGTKPNRFYDHSLDTANQNRFITGEEKARLLYGAKIVFNNMHFAEIESVNNRFFEVNGSGAFQLSDYRPILKDLLPIDPELVSFKSIDEGIEKIKYYLEHPNERYEISDKIYKHFVDNYTYDHLIKYIINLVYR